MIIATLYHLVCYAMLGYLSLGIVAGAYFAADDLLCRLARSK